MSEAEQRKWAANQAMWELEMVGEPGVFHALAQLDAMDVVGQADYLRWRRETGEHDPRQGA